MADPNFMQAYDNNSKKKNLEKAAKAKIQK
jgi:hypothetical protein